MIPEKTITKDAELLSMMPINICGIDYTCMTSIEMVYVATVEPSNHSSRFIVYGFHTYLLVVTTPNYK